MKRNKVRLTVYGLLTLGLMALIFAFSAQDGTESGGLSQWLLQTAFGQTLMRLLPVLTDEGAALDIRKYAHMAEFAALAVSSCLFFRELLPAHMPKYAFPLCLVFCFLYACSDEFHQTFVPGRAGQFSDVLVDMAGVTAGLLFTLLVTRRRKGSV